MAKSEINSGNPSIVDRNNLYYFSGAGPGNCLNCQLWRQHPGITVQKLFFIVIDY